MSKNSSVIENIENVLQDKSKQFSVYTLSVSNEAYSKLKKVLEDITNGIRKITYNTLGLFGILINKPIKASDAYTCSQFICEILNQCNINIFKKKDGVLVRPYDLANHVPVYVNIIYIFFSLFESFTSLLSSTDVKSITSPLAVSNNKSFL